MRTEEIAAFISGSISSARREIITAHLAKCAECRKVVAKIIVSHKVVPDPTLRDP